MDNNTEQLQCVACGFECGDHSPYENEHGETVYECLDCWEYGEQTRAAELAGRL